jgi:small-conductance mechanosensitive channel
MLMGTSLKTRAVTALLWAASCAVSAAPSPAQVQPPEPATIVVWNHQIAVFRTTVGGLSPSQRASAAARRIESLPDHLLETQLQVIPGKVGEKEVTTIFAGTDLLFSMFQEDLDPSSGDTLDSAGKKTAARLQEVIHARVQERRLSVLLRGIGRSLAATLLFCLGIWGIIRVRRFSLARLENQTWWKRVSVFGADLGSPVLKIEQNLIKLTAGLTGLFAGYLWLTFVLIQFFYTRPWGESLGGYLLNLGKELGTGALRAIPGLFTVVVIFLGARLATRGMAYIFARVEKGRLAVPWWEPDTARATRRLTNVLIWIFALTVAYPYIPGSNTDAFKGVSVFIGLMISLGSTGFINQVLSGLVIVYSRAFKVGDYIRVGDVEGTVTQVGTLSSKVVTRKREEITIPNAVLVGDTLTNYTRQVGKEGAIVSTSVTIGYDAPWRQIHALLLQAAGRTVEIRKDPQPFVLQRALSDFFVEYELRFHIDRPEERVPVLSELHAQIQDAFNEAGVQIMSPHFESQPDRVVFVPRAKWHSAPAQNGGSRGDGQEPKQSEEGLRSSVPQTGV